MRQIYEERAANPLEAKRVNELEQEIAKTKTYYQKRIRELENKYKFNVNLGKIEEGLSDVLVDQKPAPSHSQPAQKGGDSKKSPATNNADEQTVSQEAYDEVMYEKQFIAQKLSEASKDNESLKAKLAQAIAQIQASSPADQNNAHQ